MITIRRGKIELNARKGSEKLIEIVIIERKKKKFSRTRGEIIDRSTIIAFNRKKEGRKKKRKPT